MARALPNRDFKQKRAAATYEALLDAAARVFAERGFDAAQTPDIAAAAGVSTGAFYRYFSDKRQAFIEVMAAHLQRAYDETLKRLRPELFVGDKDVRAAIDRVLEVLFDHVRRDAPLERELIAMSMRDPEVERMRAEFEQQGLESLVTLIRAVIPNRVADARAAAVVLQVSVLELAAERAGLRPRIALPGASDVAVKRELRDMIYRYLFAPEEKPKKRR